MGKGHQQVWDRGLQQRMHQEQPQPSVHAWHPALCKVWHPQFGNWSRSSPV